MTDRQDWTAFSDELMQEVHIRAEASGEYLEDAFFEYFTEHLMDTGELETADRMPYLATGRGLRVDGYGGDPNQANGVLSLIILDFHQYEPGQSPGTLNQSSLSPIFKRLTSFLSKSTDILFRAGLEESDPGFRLSDMIATRWEDISKVRLFVLSNRVIGSKVDGQEAAVFKGIPVTYNLWDLSRLGRFITSGAPIEDTYIDLVHDYGGGIQVLPAHIPEASYQAFLAVVPGEKLARIYDRWAARLLESNVRVFLQARGGVNRGIRNTIANDPAMFFAYNNGLSATAESVETQVINGTLQITGMKNFQIVNGGQTTASIHAALAGRGTPKAALTDVFVQMKLSIIPPDRTQEVVPRISEYANTQNKVSAADFFSNHPFHQRMESFSRRLFAPSPEGQFRETKWFYERTRGQYQDEKVRSKNRRFEIEYPKNQVFTKTDLAKYLNPWEDLPHVVSRGAQKNFGQFAEAIGPKWDASQDDFNEDYFREVIARGIVFRAVEGVVTKQAWYTGGGLRSRIVPYAIAKFAFDARQRGYSPDFQQVWRGQALPQNMGAAMLAAAAAANSVLLTAPSGNPLEYGKTEACWTRVKDIEVAYPDGWLDGMLGTGERRERKRVARKDQHLLNGIEAQIKVVNTSAEVWRQALEWGRENLALSDTDLSLLREAAAARQAGLSDRQSARLLKTFSRLNEEGFPIQLE